MEELGRRPSSPMAHACLTDELPPSSDTTDSTHSNASTTYGEVPASFKGAERKFPRSNNRQTGSCSSLHQGFPEIEIVWPVCLSSDCSATQNQQCSLDVKVNRDYNMDAYMPAGECSGGPRSEDAVLVTGVGMDVLGRAAVHPSGLAKCVLSLPKIHKSWPSSSNLRGKASWRTTMRMLTLFATSSSAGVSLDGSGAAVSVLCGPPTISAELQALFHRTAWKLLTLDQEPLLPHLQMMDVHGFVVLPGSGSSSAAYTSRPHVTLFTPPAFTSPSQPSVSPSPLEDRTIHRFSCDLCSSGGSTPQLMLLSPPWLASEAERRACSRAWTSHFQPLMRDISYLLTCVPGMVPRSTWDHRTYCKTLVVMCHKGQVVSGPGTAGEPISVEFLETLLRSSRHEDITVQWLNNGQPGGVETLSCSSQKQNQDVCWQLPQETCMEVGVLSSSPDACCPQPPSQQYNELMLTGSTGGLLETNFALDLLNSTWGDMWTSDGILVGSSRSQEEEENQDPQEFLAQEFEHWRERWLNHGYTATLEQLSLFSPPSSKAVDDCCSACPSTKGYAEVATASVPPHHISMQAKQAGIRYQSRLGSGHQAMPLQPDVGGDDGAGVALRGAAAAKDVLGSWLSSTVVEVLMLMLLAAILAAYFLQQ
ncbi:hypothetical protein CEUSTIGMA_g12471.t1 [Chlamydomonas eustigma]|uniref:Uncharacterized protein n=1 Tax=Chlamydomonas eustigma TaxID=1157962 RepID=A0A250XPP6_9CHLO|nr:hypothetical protein CEUSTIGMA_g12471.t1 [Chlamydomonas eustigma]|eukprot:GAX85051.1 hypothetical protein CEUSTIGMA_g12471.t1 [Chlamydomonas eustigma]